MPTSGKRILTTTRLVCAAVESGCLSDAKVPIKQLRKSSERDHRVVIGFLAIVFLTLRSAEENHTERNTCYTDFALVKIPRLPFSTLVLMLLCHGQKGSGFEITGFLF